MSHVIKQNLRGNPFIASKDMFHGLEVSRVCSFCRHFKRIKCNTGSSEKPVYDCISTKARNSFGVSGNEVLGVAEGNLYIGWYCQCWEQSNF